MTVMQNKVFLDVRLAMIEVKLKIIKMPKGRPGGNPELEKYQFQQKYDWDEPCTEKMTLRMPPGMKAAIKGGLIEDWQEVARRAIASEIEKTTKEEN
jgi:hypothetical protein